MIRWLLSLVAPPKPARKPIGCQITFYTTGEEA